MKTTHAVVALALAALAGAAQAQPYGQRYGGYGHQGLYVHFELGLGGMETKTSGAAPELTLSGAAGQFALAVGGSITPQLGLGAELWEAAGWSPNVRASDGSASFTSDDSSSFTLLGLGPRLTFWIAPEYLNMYLSATPSLTWLSYDINGERKIEQDRGGAALGRREGVVARPLAVGLRRLRPAPPGLEPGPGLQRGHLEDGRGRDQLLDHVELMARTRCGVFPGRFVGLGLGLGLVHGW